MTIADLRAQHEEETTELLRGALESAGWRQADAAKLLDVSPNALWNMVSRRPDLAREMRAARRKAK